MKANRFLAQYRVLFGLTASLLAAPSIQAQTFSGQPKLNPSPSHLEAIVFPLSNAPSTIKVIFNNQTGGSVRVVIRNETGKVFYDEYESIAFYRRRFDLSSLPEGNYTVELSKRDEQQFTQTFAIEPPVQSRIAMTNPPIQKMPDKRADTKLIVSQNQ